MRNKNEYFVSIPICLKIGIYLEIPIIMFV